MVGREVTGGEVGKVGGVGGSGSGGGEGQGEVIVEVGGARSGEVREEVFFFFKERTAYEVLRSLVGSEMCIRDRLRKAGFGEEANGHNAILAGFQGQRQCCLLYTSDAADDLRCVELGGRRILQKKKHVIPLRHNVLRESLPASGPTAVRNLAV